MSFYRAFQFTPVVRRATDDGVDVDFEVLFQFTPVVRRATRGILLSLDLLCVSIHARRATGDEGYSAEQHEEREFQFTPVVRRATNIQPVDMDRLAVSIHARRATGDPITLRPAIRRAVSIHARRATGDRRGTQTASTRWRFNSRPSCDGRRG